MSIDAGSWPVGPERTDRDEEQGRLAEGTKRNPWTSTEWSSFGMKRSEGDLKSDFLGKKERVDVRQK